MSLFKKAPFDAENSTFKQIITFSRGNSLTGYSKRVSFEEARNKVNLLTNWICRNYKLGYLDRKNKSRDTAVRIDYFMQVKTGNWLHFLTLYSDYYEWLVGFERKSMERFLEEFYDCIERGEDPYAKLYVHAKSKSIDPLDLSLHRLRSLHFLRKYCADLIQRNVRPLGEVKHFYIEYLVKYFNREFGSDDERFFNSLMN